MKIAFAKIANNQTPFEINSNGVKFSGNLKRKSLNLISCNGAMSGDLPHHCDRCGDEIVLKLNEQINLILSDGIYKENDENLDDVVEFFDSFINLDDVLTSEIESYKSDYFYCEKCKNL